MAEPNGHKPTLGKEWRRSREEGYVIQLPSSQNYVRMRPVALDVLIMSGKLPDLLTPIAAQQLWEDETPLAIDKIKEQAELAQGFAELVNIVVPAALLEPKVVSNPTEDDEVSLDDIEFADKVAIFQLATAPVEALKTFRDQQVANVEPVPDRQDDEHASERAGGDQ